MKKEFFIGIFIGVVVNITLIVLLTPILSFNGPAVSWSISEASVLLVFILFIYKRKVAAKQ
jgi:O-antigen/teichoic acid export membrane protein